MSELAYNINGEGFEPPETATGWRVRRMKPRGAPEVVYGKDGLPLVIPIESDLEELRRSVDGAGRIRLDAVDDRSRNIEGAQPAYVVVPHVADDDDKAPAPATTKGGGSAQVIAEAMRLNTELAKSVIDRFPEMMTAAAELLRAADGAGLPRREPRVIEVDDDDDDVDDVPAAPAGSPALALIGNLLAQFGPMLVGGFGGDNMKLSSVLDWRKASQEGAAQQPPSAPAIEAKTSSSSATPSTAPSGTASADALPPIDPQTMAHFISIQSALKPDEAALAREVASNLSPTELRAWFDELSKLSVPQAVQKIRVLIAGNTEATP